MHIFKEEDEQNIFPDKHENSCCTPSNLKLKFTKRDGNVHYAYFECKYCGSRFTKFSGE